MTYVSVDSSGNATKVDAELVEDAKDDVMEAGGSLLRFDGEKVEQYEGNDNWSEVR
jgi:hypothetical protein